MTELEARVAGVLLGTALGDAFGAPFEGAACGRVEAEVARRARTARPWKYTDDTAMTLAVARALAHGRELEPERLLAELARAFDASRGHGRGMRRCIEAFLAGKPWAECAWVTWREGSAGNGSAARVAPIACRYWNDDQAVRACAALSSRVSHTHADAITGAVLQASAVALALRGDARGFCPEAFIDQLLQLRIGGWAEAKLRAVRALIASEAAPREVVAALGNGVLAIEAVPAALWSFLRGAPSFEACVLNAARLGGDVDTICAMSGALAGALCGRDALPSPWLVNLAHERPGVAAIEATAHALTC